MEKNKGHSLHYVYFGRYAGFFRGSDVGLLYLGVDNLGDSRFYADNDNGNC